MPPDLRSPQDPHHRDAFLPGALTPSRGAGLSDRDRRILTLALRKLGGAAPDFDEALRAVREAVGELIPAGRVHLLGAGGHGPIVGSIISGVGITRGAGAVLLVRVDRAGRWTALGSLPA
jgi:hypothetical protein